MNQIIKVNEQDVSVIEWKGQRVITTAQLADIYETDVNNVQNNLNRNQGRFEKGKHYFLLKGEELKSFKNQVTDSDLPIIDKFASQFYLWTRRGASRHCKILDTEKAWDQFDAMEENYFNPNKNSKLPGTYKEALQELLVQVEEKEKLETTVKIKDQQISELKPKADYMDKILKNQGLVTITQIAKDYGMSGQAMNDLLHNLKIQYKQSGQWLLYKEYQDCGYTHSETIDITRSDGRPDVKMNTKWTQKGRMFLYNLLGSHGYLPVIEQNRKSA